MICSIKQYDVSLIILTYLFIQIVFLIYCTYFNCNIRNYVLCNDFVLDECCVLVDDIIYWAGKFIHQKQVGEALLEDGNVHEGMAKTEDCR